jgi:Retrotransposon gag protein
LIGGPKVEGWIQRTYDWLDNVEANPSLLPFKMNTWQALEAEFKKAFIDYAAHERAQDELRKLRMKEGNVDKYIAAFQLLGHHAGIDLNDPSVLRLFAQGLPKSLAESCIDIELPENFEQWTSAAQRQQRNWLRKQAIRSDYASPRPQQQGSNHGRFFWHRGNQGNVQPARPRLQPCDPNAMDMSAVARKATTKTEKEKYQKEGRCFECGKQGHMVQDCLDRPRRPARARATDTTTEIGSQEGKTSYGPKELASFLKQLNDEDKDSFIKAMQEEGEELGFQDA